MTKNLDNIGSDGNSADVAGTTSLRYIRRRSLSAKQIQEMVQYNPDTGVLSWGPRPLEMCNSYEWFVWWNEAMVGKQIVGKKQKKRHAVIIKGEKFYAHDVAWAVTHGRWPRRPLIHKNGDILDNRLKNLMEAEA